MIFLFLPEATVFLLDHLLPTVMWVWVMLNWHSAHPMSPDEGGSGVTVAGKVLWSFSVSCGYLQSKMLNLQVLQPLQKKKTQKQNTQILELL